MTIVVELAVDTTTLRSKTESEVKDLTTETNDTENTIYHASCKKEGRSELASSWPNLLMFIVKQLVKTQHKRTALLQSLLATFSHSLHLSLGSVGLQIAKVED